MSASEPKVREWDRTKLKGYLVLTRQADGAWTCCPQDWAWEPMTLRQAEKACQFNRIMGGILQRPYKISEHQPCANCQMLEAEMEEAPNGE